MSLSGCNPTSTIYLHNHIAEPLGSLLLAALTREHFVQWIRGMQAPDAKG